MAFQAAHYPTLRVPIILPFLRAGILSCSGPTTEGLFRVPGDGDQVKLMVDRINRGRYELDDIEDPGILCSLFKLWLRELEEPLVPQDQYDEALALVGHDGETEDEGIRCCDFVQRLPA